MTQTGCSDKAAPLQADAATMQIGMLDAETGERPHAHSPIVQSHPSGLTATWLPFGGHLQSLRLPDGTEILAHHNRAQDYQGGQPYLGSLIGRVANRINGARFTIDGQVFAVNANENANSLHSGPDGFDRQVWDVTREDDELVFRHTSPAGHQGFPGNLDVTLRTKLTQTELRIRILAITDAPTPVNITQHGYWNPAGLFSAPIDELILSSPADQYSEQGEGGISTGASLTVDGTPFDFRQARALGPAALDVNLLVPGEGIRGMATLSDGVRSVTVLSDYMGLQLYTGDSLPNHSALPARAALAMEPQNPPNAVNAPIAGEDTILRPGEVYRHTIIYRFSGPGFEVDK